jgi:hypothetical protein
MMETAGDEGAAGTPAVTVTQSEAAPATDVVDDVSVGSEFEDLLDNEFDDDSFGEQPISKVSDDDKLLDSDTGEAEGANAGEQQEAEPVTQPVATEPTKPQEPSTVVEETPKQPLQQTDEQLAAAAAERQKARDTFVASLQDMYKLDEDTALKVMTEPETVLPQILANLHVTVLDAAVQGVMQQLPRAVQGVLESKQTVDAGKQAFFDKWPQLAAHEADVLRFGQVYRQLNPEASTEQFIEEVGAQVMVVKRIPFDAVAAPAKSAGAGSVPTAPPAPAVPGTGTNRVAKPVETNEFALLAIDEEEM